MPSTYTLNNGIELIGTGEQSGTWGDTTNTNLELLDTALDGQVTVTLPSAGTSGSPNTLAISDGAASDGRNRMVIFNDGGDLGATAYVQLTPNDAEKIIYVRNDLAGSRSIILFQGTYNASNDYEIPAGTTAVIYFDGAGSGAVAANVFNNAHFDALNIVGSVEVGADLTVDTDTLYVDSTNDRVGINNASPTHALDVSGVTRIVATGTTEHFILENTDDGASSAPDFLFYRNSVSPAADDFIGRIDFNSNNSSAAQANFATILVQATDVTATSEDGQMEFFTYVDGTETSMLTLNSTGVSSTQDIFSDKHGSVSTQTTYISMGTEQAGYISGTQAYRITTNQDFLIGQQSTPQNAYLNGTGSLTPALQVESANTVSDASIFLRSNFSTTAAAQALFFARSRGSTIGSQTIINNGDYLGSIIWAGSDGTDTQNEAASIAVRVAGTPDANDMPARILMNTNSGQVNAGTRVRIGPTGKINFNGGDAITTFGSYDFQQVGDNTVADGLAVINTLGSSMRFYVDADGIRHITSGSTDFIDFANNGIDPEYIGMNFNTAINPDGNTIDSSFPAAPLHVKSSETTAGTLILESTSGSSASAPDLYMYNNSPTPADNDNISNILIQSNNDADQKVNMAQFIWRAVDVSDGSENSDLRMATMASGLLEYRLRIDAAGRTRVGIGDFDSRENFTNGGIGAQFSVEGTGPTTAHAAVVRNSNTSAGPFLSLAKTRSTSEGGQNIVADGDTLGNLTFQGSDGTNFIRSAEIEGYVNETTPSTNNVGGGLNFKTATATNPLTRVNITASGRIGLGDVATVNGVVTVTADENTASGGFAVFSEDSGASARIWADNSGTRYLTAGTTAAMTWNSDGSKTTFPNGGGINVLGPSIFRHTDFTVTNLGATPPTLVAAYNDAGRNYTIDPGVELLVERASDAGIAIVTNSPNSSFIWFGDDTDGDIGRIVYDHSQNNLEFYTNNSQAAYFGSSGNLVFPDGQGLLFSASESGNANSSLFHDYEEGTYTPVLSFGGTNANAPAWASGTYTKIGDRVFLDVRMSWSGSLGSALGGAKVTLPFAVANSESNTQWEAIGSLYVLTGVTSTIVPAYSDVGGGLIFADGQQSATQADHTDFPTGSNFRVTGSYRTTA